MNRSVKEMTKALGTNKNVIYRIIEKLGLEPVPNDDVKAVKEYSDESYLEIKKAFRKLQEKHGDTKPENVTTPDNSELMLTLRKQIERYEDDIDRLNSVIETKDETIRQKDAYIKELTDKLTETVKASHVETMRYQELLAREQSTKLLLTAQAQSRFNLFKPSTWKRHKPDTPDLEPLTKDESDSQV